MDATPSRRRRGRWPPRSPGALAWPVFWLSMALLAVGAVLLVVAAPAEGDTPASDVASVVAFPVTPFVGALLAARRPSNPIGWLLLSAGVCSGVTVFAAGYGEWAVLLHPGSWPAGDEIAWLVTLGWFQFAVPATFVLLLFPDGTLVSRRWRPVAWAAGAGVVLSWVGFAFEPGPVEGTEFTNPFGIEEAEIAGAVGFPLVFACLMAGFVSLVVRFRRGDEQRRRQIRLLASVGGLLAAVVVGVNAAGGHVPNNPVANVVVELLLFVGLPAAVAVAVLRHRLYEIDRLIRRSAVYGVLWVAITGAYVGVAAALGIAAGSRLPVWTAVVLTIAVTLVFQPARRRLETLADRWVFGARKTRYELLTEFGSTLRDAFALDEVAPRLAQTVRAGLDLNWVSVALYLESDRGLQLHTVATDGSDRAADVQPVATVPLTHAGEALGVIECGPKTEGDLSAEDHELLATLAAQAAVAIRNARLGTELAARLDEIRHQAVELAASRSRLVQAQDAERRRIERNIHDGAQQELTGLIAKLRLARNQLGDDAGQADVALARLQDDARTVLVGLRELAQGIHPSVLTDRGLVAALQTRADRCPIPVVVETDAAVAGARFADEIEGAAYFAASEALANVLKHAAASQARVRLALDVQALRVEVADDGIGFDPGAVTGSGLDHLADRIAAVGGTLSIDAADGGGTVVVAELPARARETSGA